MDGQPTSTATSGQPGDGSATSSIARALLRESTARRLRALSHPARLRLLELLARGEKSVSELAQLTGTPADAVSKHLRALAAVRLLRRSQDGNFARYSIADPEVGRLVALAYRGVLREMQQLQAVSELTGERPGESEHQAQRPSQA